MNREPATDETEIETHWPRRVDGARRVLVLACGALAREILSLRDGPLGAFDVTCLPASLHNRPERIAEAVRGKIRANRARYDEIFCLYGDCGTGGALAVHGSRHAVQTMPRDCSDPWRREISALAVSTVTAASRQ